VASAENVQLDPEEMRKLFGKRFIGAEAAGYLVYHAVIGAWLFVAAVGFVNLV
jgi:hypothetical protein